MSHEVAGLLAVGDEIFRGTLFGAVPSLGKSAGVTGEVVFNTSMSGYQEILTDPSYAGQMICFTSAQIGNTGANVEDLESKKISAHAMIIANYTPRPSNYRSTMTLNDFLIKNGVVGIHSLDTRALTLYLRDKGVATGMILPERDESALADWKKSRLEKNHDQKYDGIDWIMRVTTQEPYWAKATNGGVASFKVVAYDYGIKQQLVRELNQRGCDVLIVPADYPSEKVLAEKPNGVFLSNGPGDPALATYAVKNVKNLLGKLPIFGVCMGHQILAMAMGAKTYKLKFGHRGGNQPVKSFEKGLVEISSHNHGFAVNELSLPLEAIVTHKNLNDNCVEGIAIPSLNAFSVQYHPESSPGPHDSSYLFEEFIEKMRAFSR